MVSTVRSSWRRFLRQTQTLLWFWNWWLEENCSTGTATYLHEDAPSERMWHHPPEPSHCLASTRNMLLEFSLLPVFVMWVTPFGFQDRGARLLQRKRRCSRHQTDPGGRGGESAEELLPSIHHCALLLWIISAALTSRLISEWEYSMLLNKLYPWQQSLHHLSPKQMDDTLLHLLVNFC